MMQGLEYLSCGERLRKLVLFRLDKRRLRGDLINVNLKEGCSEDRARLFSVVFINETRSRGHKLEHERFLLTIRKHFFTVLITEYWHRLTRDIVESLSLVIFKSCLNVVKLNSTLQTSGYRCPWLSREVGPHDFHNSFPNSAIL